MGNVLTGIVLINGRVVGTWKRSPSRGAVAVKVECLGRIAAAESSAIEAAVRRHCAFFGTAAITDG